MPIDEDNLLAMNNPGKNRFEIRVDGQRVWRVTYLPRG
jgi:hypothetical protein